MESNELDFERTCDVTSRPCSAQKIGQNPRLSVGLSAQQKISLSDGYLIEGGHARAHRGHARAHRGHATWLSSTQTKN